MSDKGRCMLRTIGRLIGGAKKVLQTPEAFQNVAAHIPLIINHFILLQSSLPQLCRYFKERQNNGHLPAKVNASNTPVN